MKLSELSLSDLHQLLYYINTEILKEPLVVGDKETVSHPIPNKDMTLEITSNIQWVQSPRGKKLCEARDSIQTQIADIPYFNPFE